MSKVRIAVLAVVLGCLAACSAGDELPSERPAQEAVGLSGNGFMPLPSVQGQIKWDGTLVDLIAADAFGFCAPWWRTEAEDDSESDEYLKYLKTKMTANPCGNTPTSLVPQVWWNASSPDNPSAAAKWYTRRTKDDECNVNPAADNTPTVIDASEWEKTTPINRWYAYDLMTELDPGPGNYGTPSVPNAPWLAKREAAQELGVAGMNLCMAGRLREEMLSADALVASANSQRELLEVIRERAGLALYQFSLLGLAFANTASTGTPTAAYQFLPALRTFALPSEGGTTRVPKLATDYARSLQLYVEATEELAELFARSASAGSNAGELGGHETQISADKRWGDASWRGRLLNLLYGGDPLGGIVTLNPFSWYQTDKGASFNAKWGFASGIVTSFAPAAPAWPGVFPHVTAPVDSPEVNTLLGLARQADALYLSYGSGASIGATSIFIYRAVEGYLLRNACLSKDYQAACSFPADGTDVINATSNESNTELWKRFRITSSHASRLANFLHQVFQHAPDTPTRAPLLLSGTYEFKTKPPQIAGPDTVDRWLHVDPNFGAKDLPPSILASRYHVNAGALVPGWDLNPTSSARLQGFVLRRTAFTQTPSPLWAIHHTGSTNESVRYMGAVPLLAAVRDGLLNGKRRADGAGVGPVDYFTLAQDMLNAIQGAIGALSFGVRPEVEPTTVSSPGFPPTGCILPASSCPALVQKYNPATTSQKIQIDIIRPVGSPAVKLVKVDRQTLVAASKSTGLLEHVANVATLGYSAADWNETSAPGTTSQNLNLKRATIEAMPTVDFTLIGDTLGLRHERALVEWQVQTTGSQMTSFFPSLPQDSPVLLLKTTTTPPTFTLLSEGAGIGSINASLSPNFETRTGSTTTVLYSTDGKYGSFGGSLNAIAARVWASQNLNFAQPAFDAFGMSTKWIPPTNPDLFGGNGGEDSVAFYLRSARTAADEATTAVRFALESVISESADTQKRQASIDRSEGIRKLQVAELCGQAEGCSTALVAYTPKYKTGCVSKACKEFERNVYLALPGTKLPTGEVVPYSLPLLAPVTAALQGGSTAPDLSIYSGGELEKLALSQWNAVRDLERTVADAGQELRALNDATHAATLHANATKQQLEAQNAAQQTQEAGLKLQAATRVAATCGFCKDGVEPTDQAGAIADPCCIAELPDDVCMTAFELADQAGNSNSYTPTEECGAGAIGAIDSFLGGCGGDPNRSWSHSPGPWNAQLMACKDAMNALATIVMPPILGVNQINVDAAYADATTKVQETWSAVSSNTSKATTLIGTILASNEAVREAVLKTNLAQFRSILDAKFEQVGFASQLTLSRRYHHYDFWRARALLEDARRLSTAARRAIEGRFAVNLSEMDSSEPFVAAPSLWADEVYEYDLDAPSAVGLSLTPNSSKDGLYPNKLSDYVRNLENFVRGYSIRRPTATAVGDGEIVTIAGPAVKQTLSPSSNETIVSGESAAWTFQCNEGDAWTSNPAAETQGKAAVNWSFSRNPLSDPLDPGPPFDNEGYGPTLPLTVFSGTVGPPLVGAVGNAVAFDGTSELWTTPTSLVESPNALTVLTWVNLRAHSANNFVLKHRPTGNWIAVDIGEVPSPAGAWQGVINVAGNHVAVNSPGSEPLPLNQWVQVGMTFDGRALRLYKNGVEVSNAQIAAAPNPPVSIDYGTHGGWSIGKTVNGYIGPTTIDTRTYTAQEILAQYKKAVAYARPSIAWQFKTLNGPSNDPAKDGCTASVRGVCASTGCGCLADACVGGSCANPFDVSVGTNGPLSLGLSGGAGTAVPGQASPSALPSVDLTGGKSLTTAATTRGESPSEITVSAWVYVRNPASGNFIHFVTKNYNAATWVAPFHSIVLGETNGGLLRGIVNVAGVNREANGTSGVPRNQWAHVAMTYNASTVRLYLNGVEKDAEPVGGAPARIDWGAHGPWFVGGNAVNGTEFLNGMISDVRIEPRARSGAEIVDLYHRGVSSACYFDDACVGTLSCCAERTEESPLRSMCNGAPPQRAKVSFHLDPWGRKDDYYANPPYTERHNVRWGRLAVNLVGVGVRDCSRAPDPTACYAESFLRYNLSHSGPSWVSDYDGNWVNYGLPIGQIEGGKALAIEEWMDPIVNGWNQSYVSAVQRHELQERPVNGAYEMELDVTRDVQLDKIERVQLLMETNYWVRQH